jgi:hypothetical protein
VTPNRAPFSSSLPAQRPAGARFPIRPPQQIA